MTDTNFPKFYPFFASYDFYHLFLLKDRLNFIIWKMSAKYSSLNGFGLTVILSSKNSVLWEKQLVHLATQSLNMYFSLRQPWHCSVQQKIFYTLPILVIQNIKKISMHGLKFLKINNLYCLIKDIVEIGIFFNCKSVVINNSD